MLFLFVAGVDVDLRSPRANGTQIEATPREGAKGVTNASMGEIKWLGVPLARIQGPKRGVPQWRSGGAHYGLTIPIAFRPTLTRL